MRYSKINNSLLNEINKEYNKIILRRNIIKLIVYIIAPLISLNFIFGLGFVDGDSMYPTLANNDFIVFNKIYKNIKPEDIIVFSLNDELTLIKRVIAVEGDEVDFVNNKITVNGNEIGIYNGNISVFDKSIFPLKLEKNQLFVMGDNAIDSIDSRYFGVVDVKNVKGKLKFMFRIKF